MHVARIIIRSEENKLAAVYRGLSPNLVGNSVSWALYFVWYDKVKKHLQLYHGENSKLSYYDFFLASGVAGREVLDSDNTEEMTEPSTRDAYSHHYESHLGNQNSHALNVF